MNTSKRSNPKTPKASTGKNKKMQASIIKYSEKKSTKDKLDYTAVGIFNNWRFDII